MLRTLFAADSDHTAADTPEAVQRDLRQLQEMQLGAPEEPPLQTKHPIIIWQAPPAE